MNLTIKTFINGREIPRAQVLEWERRRALVVLRKLGVRPSGQSQMAILHQLEARKQELGSEGMLRVLRKELMISEPAAVLFARLSAGARRFSITELVASGGRAEDFVAWFNERGASNDEQAMRAATPDHYVIRTNANGSQEVVETNGGSPLVARFFVDYNDQSGLRSRADSNYPLQIAGVACSASGVALGGVRHQFRNEGNGFRAKLLVEYPLLVLPQILPCH
jgi:hypothetical protein